MKSSILFFFMLFCFNSSFGQKSNTEIGVRLYTINKLLLDDYSGNASWNTLYQGPGRYESPFQSSGIGSLHIIKDIKTSGFYSPGIFIRKKISRNFWAKALFEFYSLKTITTKPVSIQNGSLGEYYSSYYKKTSGFNFEYALQYQWLNKNRIYAYSGIEAKMMYYQKVDKTTGSYSGCFSGGPLVQENGNMFKMVKAVKLVHGIGVPFYKKYNIGYEMAFPMFINRFWISRFL